MRNVQAYQCDMCGFISAQLEVIRLHETHCSKSRAEEKERRRIRKNAVDVTIAGAVTNASTDGLLAVLNSAIPQECPPDGSKDAVVSRCDELLDLTKGSRLLSGDEREEALRQMAAAAGFEWMI